MKYSEELDSILLECKNYLDENLIQEFVEKVGILVQAIKEHNDKTISKSPKKVPTKSMPKPKLSTSIPKSALPSQSIKRPIQTVEEPKKLPLSLYDIEVEDGKSLVSLILDNDYCDMIVRKFIKQGYFKLPPKTKIPVRSKPNEAPNSNRMPEELKNKLTDIQNELEKFNEIVEIIKTKADLNEYFNNYPDNINFKDLEYESLLIYAIRNSVEISTDCIAILLKHNIDVNAFDEKGENAFIKAFKDAKQDVIALLLKRDDLILYPIEFDYFSEQNFQLQISILKSHENINISQDCLNCLLFQSLILPDLEAAGFFLRRGADIDCYFKSYESYLLPMFIKERSLIEVADDIKERNLNIIDWLLKNNTNLYFQDNEGYTAFQIAFKAMDKQVIELFINCENLQEVTLTKECFTREYLVKQLEVIKNHSTHIVLDDECLNYLFYEFAATKNFKEAECLIKMHADINYELNNQSLFANFIDNNDFDSILWLVENGFGLNSIYEYPPYYEGEASRQLTLLQIVIEKFILTGCENEVLKQLIIDIINKGANLKIDVMPEVPLIIWAVEQNLSELISIILEKNPTLIDTRDEHKNTILHIAVQKKNTQMIHQLLSSQNLNHQNQDGNTPLHIAILNRDIDTVIKLIQAGALLNCQDNHGETPLHLAINAKFYNAVNELIIAGADVNALDRNTLTPIFVAINNVLGIGMIEEDKKIIELLIHSGANLDATCKINNREFTLLEVAAGCLDRDLAEFLVKYGSTIKTEKINDILNSTENSDKKLQEEFFNIIKYPGILLYKNIIDLINKLKSHDIFSTIKDKIEVMEKVIKDIKRNLSTNIKSEKKYDSYNMIFLQYVKELLGYCSKSKQYDYFIKAIKNGNKKTIQHYINMNKEFLNMKNNAGMTPLMIAVKAQQIDSVKFLVQNKANIEEVNERGFTVLHIAVLAKSADTNIIKYIIENDKAILDKPEHKSKKDNTSSNTPILLAALNGREEAVTVLKSLGAKCDQKELDERLDKYKRMQSVKDSKPNTLLETTLR